MDNYIEYQMDRQNFADWMRDNSSHFDYLPEEYDEWEKENNWEN